MESFQEVFNMVSDYCLEKVSDTAHKVWISPIKPLRMEGSTAYLFVPAEYHKGILEEKYIGLLTEAFETVMGFPIDVKILCEEAARPQHAAARPQTSETRYVQEEIDNTTLNGDYEYTFSTFIVGPSNKFAHAASQAVADKPAGEYNPLFIYGGSGLGKTHLLYAICNEIEKSKPGTVTVYTKGEEFTNELIDAIRNESTKAFHDKYRQADVLLVDDIQFIGGKESTQEEFFHTFNTLYQSGKQIVLTSDRPPKEIKTLEDRLRTRFESGLMADIQPPELETRIAIIRRKAELLKISIPADVAEYIANQLKTNIRQLEGAVKKLKAYKDITGTEPSIMAARNAIRDILNDNQPVPVTVDRIITEVARTYSISASDIRSNKRAAQISVARQAAVYIVREITQMSMAAIGEEFGGRDHSTIVYALRQAEKNMAEDGKYRARIEDIIKNIRDS